MKDIHILLVEDNEGDILLTREALKEAKIKNEMSVVMDGEEALAFLSAALILPDLILLDINLPKLNGLEVLAAVKRDERLKTIPVIVLTTSSTEKDIMKAHASHADCFITKPVDLARFIDVIKTIEDFWISIVRTPQQKRV